MLSLKLICVLLAMLDIKAPAGDVSKARLKSCLDATGLNYEQSASGLSFVAVFDIGETRKQRVFVTIVPEAVGDFLTHSIYTTVWTSKEPPSAEIVRKVFGRTKKVGHFYLYKDKQGVWAIRFGAHFDAAGLPDNSTAGDTLSTQLKDLIYIVEQVGDETDLELNGPGKDIQ